MSLLITRGLGATEGAVYYKDVASQITARIRLKEKMRAHVTPEQAPVARTRTKLNLRGKVVATTVLEGFVVEKMRLIGRIKDDD